MLHSDFYFTYDYHALSVQSPNTFSLIDFKKENFEIALPIIIRPIPNSEFFDASSVYGYAGPLYNSQNIPDDILHDFQNELINVLNELKIVSLFSRLHPFIKNENLIPNFGEIVSLSETVYINLKLSLEEQYQHYRKGVKSDIKALLREGYEVYEDVNLNYIDEFISIYNENMHRVGAAQMYFFPKEYYYKFFESKEIGAKLYIVKKGEEVVCGSIIVFSDSIIQYHLSGTKTMYLRNSPVRLLLDRIRLNFSGNKYDIFHLGGGVGSAEDSLFNFKAGFSKERLKFKIWKLIVNQQIYDDLCNKAEVSLSDPYFPAYRSSSKHL